MAVTGTVLLLVLMLTLSRLARFQVYLAPPPASTNFTWLVLCYVMSIDERLMVLPHDIPHIVVEDLIFFTGFSGFHWGTRALRCCVCSTLWSNPGPAVWSLEWRHMWINACFYEIPNSWRPCTLPHQVVCIHSRCIPGSWVSPACWTGICSWALQHCQVHSGPEPEQPERDLWNKNTFQVLSTSRALTCTTRQRHQHYDQVTVETTPGW